MSQTFIDFFEKIRDQEIPGHRPDGNVAELEDVEVLSAGSDDAVAEAQRDENRAQHMAESSEEDLNRNVLEMDWDEVKQSTRLGPLLTSLRDEQEKQPMSQRETYSIEHLKRLYQFVPKRPYSKPRANKLCSKFHPKPCPYQCRTCHFCRQRTTEPKTVCSVCDGVNNYYGGPARGYWCGSCLWLRIGENIDEVRDRSDWVCPACRDICNCSGANCMRLKRGWFPTNQLSHEAREQGYKSVAHYLVLTHLSQHVSAAPMALALDGMKRRRRSKNSSGKQTPAESLDEVPSGKQGRLRCHRDVDAFQTELPLQYKGQRTRKEALERASKPRLQREILSIMKDLGSDDTCSIFDKILYDEDYLAGQNRGLAGKVSTFLCILDQDMRDEEDEEEDFRGNAGRTQYAAPDEEENNIENRWSGNRTDTASAANKADILHTRTLNYDSSSIMGTSKLIRGQNGVENPVGYQMSSLKVAESVLPPREPNVRAKRKRAAYHSPRMKEAENHGPQIEGVPEGYQEDMAVMARPNEPVTLSYRSSPTNSYFIGVGSLDNRVDAKAVNSEHDIGGISLDEFVWNSLCLRAVSIVEAVKTFYKFHPDVNDQEPPLISEPEDRKLYDIMYEGTLANLLQVLRSAEVLATENAIIGYSNEDSKHLPCYPGTLRTVGGVRRAVQLLTYLSRILPKMDVTWRIEKRMLGLEPFADFNCSSPHTKAILLRGRLELVAILHKRGMCTQDALRNIGDTLASIALDMKTSLPLLDAIVENRPMPLDDCVISGWSYDSISRGKRLIDIFSDLSVLYASLHEVLLLGICRLSEICAFIGIQSHHILTKSLVDILIDVDGSYPTSIVKRGFTLICTVLETAFNSFEEESIGITVEERNRILSIRSHLLDCVESQVIPRLEQLVQKDYNLWGRVQSTPLIPYNSIKSRIEGIGSEKVEVLGRCYALLLKGGKKSWIAIESKATQPYSFSQYWKYANLRYRNFSLYLLAHTLENAPHVTSNPANLPSILRMWLLSVLDFGRHESSWYLTSILACQTQGVLPKALNESLDFRKDKDGEKRYRLLKSFGEYVMAGPLKNMIGSILLLVDECLQERQREIVQTLFDGDDALLKWQRPVVQALIGLLESLAVPLCSPLNVGKELRKLLRRCAIWMLESMWFIKKRSTDANKNNRGFSEPLDAFEKEQLITEADIRQELEASTCGALRQIMSLIDLLRVSIDNVERDETEFMESLWIIIAGVIEMGDGDAVQTSFELVMYDKVASSIFEASPIPISDFDSLYSHSIPLSRYVLGTHVRRYILKTNCRHQQSERFGVNAMRFAQAVFNRPEMRSVMNFKRSFDLMMSTWINIMAQSGDADSLSVRFELIGLLRNAVKCHPSVLVGGKPSNTFSHIYHLFWKIVCGDCLKMVQLRFPEAILPSVSLEAEYLFCQLLRSYPGLEFILPSTPQQLTDLYNQTLGELGRPLSTKTLDSIYAKMSLDDIIPKAFLMRQKHSMANFRPGDFAWKLARLSISLLSDLVQCPGDLETELGTITPGCWLCLCCLPYLQSIWIKGDRASLLIESEYYALLKSVECRAAGISDLLKQTQKPQLQQTAQKALVKEAAQPPVVRRSPVHISHIKEISRLDVGDVIELECYLVNVRKIERNGVCVAVCSLSDNKEPRNEICINVLVSKPIDTVYSLLKMDHAARLPQKVSIRGIEYVRQQSGAQMPVARSTEDFAIVHLQTDS